jgi:outer membrane receptor for ferric coprogen and ferric-rhodotorulic acid
MNLINTTGIACYTTRTSPPTILKTLPMKSRPTPCLYRACHVQNPLQRRLLCLALIGCLAAPPLSQAADNSSQTTTLDKIDVHGDRSNGYTAPASSSATGLILSQLETPQSISTITRQQLDDFELNTADAALALATGVNVEVLETDRTYYTARGFDITNFLVDGLGLPFTNGGAEGEMDTAIYERIEVLRGANGLMSSSGNPSATINFVRKRPTTDFQANLGLGGGSWSNYRVDADVSGPLNHAGSVRGRAAAVWQDGDSYLDRYSKKKTVLYGIVEADLSPSTLLSAGVSYQKNEPTGSMWGALPLYYSDGSSTNYDSSTSTAADWSYWNTTDKRAFLELEQALGGDWKLKASLNYRDFESAGDLFYVYGAPVKGSDTGLYAYPSHYTSQEQQKYANLQANGSFTVAGRRHEAVIGLRWDQTEVDQLSLYGEGIGTDIGSLESWTGNYAKPAFTAGTGVAEFDITRKTAYASVRWDLTERLKLITGLNYTQAESTGQTYGVIHDYDTSDTSPFVGAVYNFDPNYALYASYAEIFNPQFYVDVNNQVLDPITGSNAELGIKGQWLEGRLNGSLAIFRVKQDNVAANATYSTTTLGYYYTPVDATSTGFEADISGQLGEYAQISAGYTQLSLKDEAGDNTLSYVPRRTFKLAGTYRIPQWQQLKVGANMRWQSQVQRTRSSATGITRQGSYAVFGLMAGYDFSPQLSATLNLNNVADRKYISSLYWDQGLYGAERNWWLSLNYRF